MADIDFPCSRVWPSDDFTYPVDDSYTPPVGGWLPGAVGTSWGLMSHGELSLSDQFLGPALDEENWIDLDNSLIIMGADWDPIDEYNDGTLTESWWDMSQAYDVEFPPCTGQPPYRMVLQEASVGWDQRFWIGYYTPDNEYRAFFFDVGNQEDYVFREWVIDLPEDFPPEYIENGWEGRLHFTTSGGIYDCRATYLAVRATAADEPTPQIEGRPEDVRRIFVRGRW